jgi:tetratricopeptide (TPR) repeat protein
MWRSGRHDRGPLSPRTRCSWFATPVFAEVTADARAGAARLAQTQHNLGVALFAVGNRESGTASLEQAVAAYRAALQVRTMQGMPLDFAWSQHNLGLTLSLLGEREGGTAQLEESVAAYDAALDGFAAAGATANANTCRANRDKALTLLTQRGG